MQGHLDYIFLLSLIVQHWRGNCEEALRYAEEHLKRRKRGLESIWTINLVRATLESIRRGIEIAEKNATGTTRQKQ